ncbi:Histidinol-phosphate aminotransferase [Candidatus Magnetomorum sp. HK-1]|nr:Histidinol-phosphate aminotransferase [Candidatus Magnetomorum sp. HK-1]
MEKYINQWIKRIKPRETPQRPKDIVDLFIGENPYPPSPHVLKAIGASAETINRYPDSSADAVKEKLAEYTNTSKEQIFVGNGSDDLIELVIKVFVGQREEVIIPIPGYFAYWRYARIRGSLPVLINRKDNFDLDIEKLVQAGKSPKSKIVFIGSPNNPTGNIVPRQEVIELLNRMDCIVVIDECYFEFSQYTVVDLLNKHENLIILRSLSKSFGLGGIRFGYGIAHPKIVQYFKKAVQIYPVNKLAQAAAIAALEDHEFIQANIKRIQQAREDMTQKLRSLGFIVYPSESNCLLVRTEPLGISGQDLVESLKAKNIFVQNLSFKQGFDAYFFRTAIGTYEENQILLDNLKQILSDS